MTFNRCYILIMVLSYQVWRRSVERWNWYWYHPYIMVYHFDMNGWLGCCCVYTIGIAYHTYIYIQIVHVMTCCNIPLQSCLLTDKNICCVHHNLGTSKQMYIVWQWGKERILPHSFSIMKKSTRAIISIPCDVAILELHLWSMTLTFNRAHDIIIPVNYQTESLNTILPTRWLDLLTLMCIGLIMSFSLVMISTFDWPLNLTKVCAK